MIILFFIFWVYHRTKYCRTKNYVRQKFCARKLVFSSCFIL